MNTDTRVTKFSKSITLGEHRALQSKVTEEYFVFGSAKKDDEFIAEHGWLEYSKLYWNIKQALPTIGA